MKPPSPSTLSWFLPESARLILESGEERLIRYERLRQMVTVAPSVGAGTVAARSNLPSCSIASICWTGCHKSDPTKGSNTATERR